MNFDTPSKTPIMPAQQWFDEAVAAKATLNPLAVALSTVDLEGKPSTRMVLLKGFDEKGAVFYTNLNSPKAADLEKNKYASMLFHWDDCQRQLRIRGTVTKVTEEESDAYFATRQKLNQVGAWTSQQSQPLKSRAALMEKVAALMAKWTGRNVPRPEHWGGFRVSLEEIEFWQGQEGRLHDRIRYTCNVDQWSWARLQP